MRQKSLLSVFIIILLLPAFGYAQTVIPITEGDDKIDGALFTAAAGDIIELTTDGGVYNETFTALIDIPVTIRAAAGLTSKPTWTCDNPDRMITLSSQLTLDGIILDGSLGDSLTADGIRTGSEAGIVLKVNNCVFRNFNDGVAGDEDGHAIKGKQEARVDTIIVTNSRFEHMPGEHISYKDGVADSSQVPVKYTRIEHCTFWDGDNEAIYIEDNDSDSATPPHPETIINHVTAVDFGPKPFYPKETDGAVVKNSIVVNTPDLAVTIYQSSVIENFLYYNTPGGINTKDNSSYDTDLVLEEQNPYFEDEANGGFAVAANSPAALFADDGTALGDSNNGTWDAAEITRWEYVENNMFDDFIEDVITEGDTVVFVTSGGYYTSESYLKVEQPSITLMAAPGLEEKPVLKTAPNTGRIVRLYQPHAWVTGLKFEAYGYKIQVEGQNTPYGLQFEDATGTNLGTVIVEDCEFTDFRLRGIHCDDNNWVDTLIVNNCFFNKIGESGMYNSGGGHNIGYAKITNSTFYKCGQKGMYIREQGMSPIEVSHCTFFYSDSTLTGRTGNRGVYARNDSSITVRDNIFAQFADYAVQVYGPSPVVEYNLFWLCDSTIKNGDDPDMTFPVFNDTGDPMFADTSEANLDLAIALSSVAFEGASDGSNLGDPRWGTWDASGLSDRNTSLPNTYTLDQNYPNPFNPSTTINFSIAEPGNVVLTIFNVLGQEIETLLDEQMRAGKHTVTWSAADHSTGIYFYMVKVNEFESIKKMLLIK
jgi:hypothetical protein